VQVGSLEARNTGEEIQNTKSEREKAKGAKDLHRLFFLLFTGFSYYFNWLKIERIAITVQRILTTISGPKSQPTQKKGTKVATYQERMK
jgi:hypothetical protein